MDLLDVEGLIRDLLWAMCNLVLNIVDALYEIAKRICSLDLTKIDFIWQWYDVLVVFFVLFLLFRIFKVFFKSYIDQDFMQKLNVGKVMVMLFVSIFSFSMFPYGFAYLSDISNSAIENIAVFTNSSPDASFSSILVQQASIDISADLSKNADDINNLKKWKNEHKKISESKFNSFIADFDWAEALVGKYSSSKMVIISSAIANNLSSISELTYKQYSDYYDKTYGENIDINKIDINECYELDDGVPVLGDIPVANWWFGATQIYYFFPSYSSLFFGLMASVSALFMFLPICLQMAVRVIGMILKIMLSPYALSSLVDPESNSFKVWSKSLLSDLLLNFFQLYSMILIFTLYSSSDLDKAIGATGYGMFVKLFLFLGGLLAVVKAPAGITEIIGGGELGAASSAQGFMGLLAAAGFIMHPKQSLQMRLNPASLYGGGRQGGRFSRNGNSEDLGENGLNEGENIDTGFNQKDSSNEQFDSYGNNMSSEEELGADGNLTGGSGKSENSYSTSSSSPTELQLDSAKYYGIEGAEKMSQQQLKQEFTKRGYGSSFPEQPGYNIDAGIGNSKVNIDNASSNNSVKPASQNSLLNDHSLNKDRRF
jgi:hypothetical protein